MALKVGEIAPDFSVRGVVGERQMTCTLSEYRGKKHLVLAFYPLDWTPVWTAQMPAYQMDLDKFAGYDAQVMGMSIDSIYSHIAWQRNDIGWLEYPLASDFYPHGEVAKKFDVFRDGPPQPGINERAIFIINKEGVIVFSKVYDLGQQPDNEDVFAVLRELKGESAGTQAPDGHAPGASCGVRKPTP